MLLPLATLPDAWLVGFGIFQLIFSAFVSIAIMKLSQSQRRYDGLEDKLHDTTTKLVDERFRAVSHKVAETSHSFGLAVAEMKDRIKDIDQVANELQERDQRNELAVVNRLDSLKDWLRNSAANKDDLKSHNDSMARRVERIENDLSGIAKSVAVLSDKVGPRQ